MRQNVNNDVNKESPKKKDLSELDNSLVLSLGVVGTSVWKWCLNCYLVRTGPGGDCMHG